MVKFKFQNIDGSESEWKIAKLSAVQHSKWVELFLKSILK